MPNALDAATRRLLNQLARAECDAANAEARQSAAVSGAWDERAWLHPDEWTRMRSALAVLIGAIRADGIVSEDEQASFSLWVETWLDRSHWAGFYTDAKLQQIAILATRLAPSAHELRLCALDCYDQLSETQQLLLVDLLDKIMEPAAGSAATLIGELRQAVLLGSFD